MKRTTAFIIVICLLCTGLPGFAVDQQVKVSLPDYEVTINGTRIENTYRSYPVLTYKNIAYFPLTYYDCRFLGLESKWSDEEGLSISSTGLVAEYRDYASSEKNQKTDYATVSAFDISINGSTVDNGLQDYPLLTYRGVTYFPVTWELAVDQFGWTYGFDTENGLVIHSNGQYVQFLDLENEIKTINSLYIVDGYIYYAARTGDTAYIYQAPVEALDKKEPLLELVRDDIYAQGEFSTNFEIIEKEDAVYLSYHVGGATFGRTSLYKVDDAHKLHEFESGYISFEAYGDGYIKQIHTGPPTANNMVYVNGIGEEHRLGDEGYIFSGIYVDGDFLYTRAYPLHDNAEKLYKINMKTNEMTMISDVVPLGASLYKVDKSLFFIDKESGFLYKLDTEKDRVDLSVEAKLMDYALYNKELYFIEESEAKLFKRLEDNRNQPMFEDLYFYDIDVQGDYMLLYYHEEIDDDRGLIVVDADENMVFKTSDWIINAVVDGNAIYYKTLDSQNTYSYKLQGN